MKPEIRTIGEHEYRLIPFGFDEWCRLTAELASVSSPAAGAIAALRGGQAVEIGGSLQELAQAVLMGTRSGLIDRLCSRLDVNIPDKNGRDNWRNLKTSVNRDAVWTGRYSEGIRAIVWVLEVAFAGFWRDISSAWPVLAELLGGLGAPEMPEVERPESEPAS